LKRKKIEKTKKTASSAGTRKKTTKRPQKDHKKTTKRPQKEVFFIHPPSYPSFHFTSLPKFDKQRPG